MKKIGLIALSLALLLLLNNSLSAQSSSRQIENYYSLLRKNFNASKALQTVAFVEQRWRLAGNTGFNESIYEVEKILQDAGFKKEVNNEREGALTYRIEKRPMKQPAWEPEDAVIKIAGDEEPLLQFRTNRNMVAIHSASTVPQGVEGEIVYVGKGSKKELDEKDLAGKIVFAEGYIGGFYNTAISKGAMGVIAYSMPTYNQPETHPGSIQFTAIPWTDSMHQKWGILLSYKAKERLKAAMANGPVKLWVMVRAKNFMSEELTLVANVKGSTHPDERFVFSAHVQEPGANDNASGVGTLAEMARTTAWLVTNKSISPQRTITFLWGDEIISTDRYIRDDSVRAQGILWGMSLDMVGEDASKTGGSFLIEKMPDPSAIWTRGAEKHTEWGGDVLHESDIRPHYFNDFVLNRCLDQAKQTGWVVKTNPYEGGSDHTPFLTANKPGLLMWHFTDVYYHTDNDRLDMVSAAEMRNVGISALASAYTLASANEHTTLFLIDEIKTAALKRLDTELSLSKEALQKGSTPEKEGHILKTWAQYYKGGLSKMTDINVQGPSGAIKKRIEKDQQTIDEKYNICIRLLSETR